jgi:multidrug resistance efflux pump
MKTRSKSAGGSISESTDELLGKVPQGLLYYGSALLFSVFCILFVGAWFIQYPDIIAAPIVISLAERPKPILTKSAGKIDYVLVKNEQNVFAGQVLLVMENSADYHIVLGVKHLVDVWDDSVTEAEFLQTNHAGRLGEIEPAYAAFLGSSAAWQFRKASRTRDHLLINSMKKQAVNMHELVMGSERQTGLVRERLTIQKRNCQKDSLLFSKSLIPAVSFDEAKALLLQYQIELENSINRHSDLTVQLEGIEQSLLNFENAVLEKDANVRIALFESFNNLVAALSRWEEAYVLKSPIGGMVHFVNELQPHQILLAGQIVMSVVSVAASDPVGVIQLPMTRSGQVQTGQRVVIKLDGYPYMQYGVLHGKIGFIHRASSEGCYFVQVLLPDGLKTSTGHIPAFKTELRGMAEIATEEKSLLVRMLYPLRYAFSRSKGSADP